MNFIKPKFWDKKNLSLMSFLLLPFTLPIILNNFFLNNSSKLKSNKLISICIGNIYLGGTGKTPTVIKIYEILKSIKINTVTAKKIYKKQNDELILLKKKSNLVADISRLKIIDKAIEKKSKVVIFDDGLQDRNINYDLKFVCFDSTSWIGNGQLIPAGPLREKISSLKKYDAIFLKNLNKVNRKIISKIKEINPDIKIFNSVFKVSNLKEFNLKKKYLIFSGIGNPNNFKNILEKHKFNIVDEIFFPDHHQYSEHDILKILERARELKVNIITTEKDAVKIPKYYLKKIKSLNVELDILEKRNLIDFLKSKIYE